MVDGSVIHILEIGNRCCERSRIKVLSVNIEDLRFCYLRQWRSLFGVQCATLNAHQILSHRFIYNSTGTCTFLHTQATCSHTYRHYIYRYRYSTLHVHPSTLRTFRFSFIVQITDCSDHTLVETYWCKVQGGVLKKSRRSSLNLK
jgi:hypothetical protein